MERNSFELQVRVHGKPVREYHHEGRVFIEGRKSSDFVLRINNKSFRRILAVPTVDGLSVMDGKEASYDSGGYVIDPFGYINIPGWRLDDDQVAKFFFAKQQAAYAAKMDKPTNIGVIACAIFTEKEKPPTLTYFYNQSGIGGIGGGATFDSAPFTYTSHSAAPIGSRGVVNVNCCHTVEQPTAQDWQMQQGEANEICDDHLEAQNLGTGFGKRQGHRVTTVTFERASETPEAVLELNYDDREGLQRRGVNLSKKGVVGVPNPFPAQRGCMPPRGWNG
jgi:hypothetical protein